MGVRAARARHKTQRNAPRARLRLASASLCGRIVRLRARAQRQLAPLSKPPPHCARLRSHRGCCRRAARLVRVHLEGSGLSGSSAHSASGKLQALTFLSSSLRAFQRAPSALATAPMAHG